jgi:hypothetical protein
MFSGGEKKSFYKLKLVIGTFTIALKLKQTIYYVQKQRVFLHLRIPTLKAAKSSIFPFIRVFYHDVQSNREQVKNAKNKDYRPLGSYLEAARSDFRV